MQMPRNRTLRPGRAGLQGTSAPRGWARKGLAESPQHSWPQVTPGPEAESCRVMGRRGLARGTALDAKLTGLSWQGLSCLWDKCLLDTGKGLLGVCGGILCLSPKSEGWRGQASWVSHQHSGGWGTPA